MKKYITSVLSLFIITVCVVGLVAYTNNLTEDIIKNREQKQSEAAMSLVLPDGAPFNDITQDLDESLLHGAVLIKQAVKSDKGYVFIVVTKGYAGDITVYVAIGKNGKVENIMLGDNSETPNLGKNAELPEFTSQFSGLSQDDDISAKIDYVSMATVTSKAVIAAVDGALDLYEVIK